MKISSTTLVLAAALGAAARPSGHGHGQIHRALEKRLEFVMNEKPEAPAAKPVPAPIKNAVLQAPGAGGAAAAAAVVAAVSAGVSAGADDGSAPAPKPATGSGSGIVSSGPKKFCGGISKRATLAQIAYKGNVGVADHFGCNIMMVDDATGYDYSATMKNKSGKPQKCVVWLKTGHDGKVDGFFKGNEVLTFDLDVNGQKVLVAQADSQGGVACSPDSIQMTPFGQFSATWLEFDFANTSNQQWSGADASCLVPAAYNQPIQAMSVCAAGKTCSVINNGGTGSNAYLAGMAALDGIGINLPPGPAHFDVTIG